MLYETPSGQPVIEVFIKSMQTQTQAKLVRQLDLLEEFGPRLGMPHARPMDEGLYELRVRGTQEVRIFYIFALGTTIYLLHAFQKKTQETPKRELDTARRRQAEIDS